MPSQNFIGVYLVILLTAPIAPFSLYIYSDRRDGDDRYGNFRKEVVYVYIYYYTVLGLTIWSLVTDLIVADLVFWFRLIMGMLCALALLFCIFNQWYMVSENYIGRRTERKIRYSKLKQFEPKVDSDKKSDIVS